MIVVSDTSVISALLSIDKLELLPQLYGRVIIPQLVWDELIRLEEFGYDFSKEFHVWGVEWTPYSLRFFLLPLACLFVVPPIDMWRFSPTFLATNPSTD